MTSLTSSLQTFCALEFMRPTSLEMVLLGLGLGLGLGIRVRVRVRVRANKAPGDGLIGQHVEEAVGSHHEILDVGGHLDRVGVRVRVRVRVRLGVWARVRVRVRPYS